MFSEQPSSVGPRKALGEVLAFVRSGDTFMVTKLDRLACSVPHMWEIVQRLQAKGVTLRIVNLGIDTATPTGKLMLNVLGGVAEFEREMMLERQDAGASARGHSDPTWTPHFTKPGLG
jgi:DNA invertase Pin-like site-specific DNA recombinase